jgi:D-alanine-D-alanine ligase
MKKAIILINKISENPGEDELDVLKQADEVEASLSGLGYDCSRLFLDLNLERVKKEITGSSPDIVFNLVETVDSRGDLIYLATALLEGLRVPFTGCTTEPMFITSNKILTKKLLKQNKINTPEWYDPNNLINLGHSGEYIAKPLWEDGSVGINDVNVFKGRNVNVLEALKARWGKHFFIEEYIDGREFNISILGGTVMPAAEIIFKDFPEDKPKIVGYAAKWDQDTFEYKNTRRGFNTITGNSSLEQELIDLSMRCWEVFNLRGYARVDFRVDRNDKPFVLEINANPCISSDAGFFAACSQAGLTYKEMIERIINDAFK